MVFGGRTQDGPTNLIHALRPDFAPNPETLPVPLYGHCIVFDKHSTKVYIIGGYHGRVDENIGISSDVWLMDYSKIPAETVLLNSLRTPRMEHMCGLIVETENEVDQCKIIVAGGFDGTNSLDSIEIFETSNDYNQWRYSKSSLNQALHGGAMVSDSTLTTLDYDLAIIGGKSIGRGFSNKVTHLTWNSAENDIDVKDHENTLNYVRADFALIDHSTTICPPNPTTSKPTVPTEAPTEALTEAPTNAPTNAPTDPITSQVP